MDNSGRWSKLCSGHLHASARCLRSVSAISISMSRLLHYESQARSSAVKKRPHTGKITPRRPIPCDASRCRVLHYERSAPGYKGFGSPIQIHCFSPPVSGHRTRPITSVGSSVTSCSRHKFWTLLLTVSAHSGDRDQRSWGIAADIRAPRTQRPGYHSEVLHSPQRDGGPRHSRALGASLRASELT